MLSDISIKYSASAIVSMYQMLNRVAVSSSPKKVKMTAVAVCVAEVTLDTLKHPAIVLENGAFALVNLLGASCSEQCSLKDAAQNVKKMAIGTLTTLAAVLIAAPKFVIQTNRVLADPLRAVPYNPDARKEMQFQPVFV